MDTHPDTEPEEVRRAKSALRVRTRALRRAIPPDARAKAARAIAERALKLPEFAGIEAAMLYGASPEEADTRDLEMALRALGTRIAYPRVAGPHSLTVHWVDDPECLVTGAFGLREPHADAPRLRLSDVGVIVVPGVAFDADGYRLGFGGGFYDALLAEPGPHRPTIGIAYDEQMVTCVPRASHDRPVDVVVTPTRTLRPATRQP